MLYMVYSAIRHLVLSGGFLHGLSIYGAIRELDVLGAISTSSLQSVYATSCGGIIGITVALKYDWAYIDDYLLNRPWNDVFRIDIETVLGISHNRGVFSRDAFVTMLSPLLLGKDIPITATLADFHKATGVDIHFFATEVDTFTSVDICANTHPDWNIIDAVYASCCLPGFFAPLIHGDKMYIDGMFINNCPVDECLAARDGDDTEILVMKMKDDVAPAAAKTTTLLEFMHLVVVKQISRARKTHVPVTHEIAIPRANVGECDITSFVKYKAVRESLVDAGVVEARRIYAAFKP